MGRIRTVKPEFFTNERLSALHPETHLLAAGLLCYADDEGYFNAHPGLVQAAIFPVRECSQKLPVMLQSLSSIGYIQFSEGSDGRKYGRVVSFSDHQVVSHARPSKIKTLCHDWINPVIVHEHSSTPQGDFHQEGKGMEVEGKGREVEGEAEPALHPLHFAHKMIQVLSIPNTQANMRAIEAALSAECQFTGSSLEECAQAISDHAMRARAQGSAIDKFYFEDTKWRSNGSRKQTSAAVERVNRNRGNLIEALRSHVGERTGSDGGKR